MAKRLRNFIGSKRVKIRNRRHGQHRAARFVTAFAIAVVVVSFFAARTHLAWAGKETARTIANKAKANNAKAKDLKTEKLVGKETAKDPIGGEVAPGAKVTSASLIKSLARASAYVAKSAKAADKKLVSPKTKRQEPFFAALKKTNTNLKALVASTKAKDDKKLFGAMDRAGKSVNELETAHRLSGIKDPKIAEGVKKLVDAFKTFRKNFGKEAMRKKKGGKLTPKETDQAKALEAKYRKSLADLNALKAKASTSKAPGAKASLAQINSLINQMTSMLAPPKAKPAAGAAGAKPAAGAAGAAGGGPSLGSYSRMLMFDEDFAGSWYAISSYQSLVDPKGYASYGYGGISASVADIDSYTSTAESSFEVTSAEYWSYSESTSIETTESYEVTISDAEVTQSDAYLADVDLDDVSVDPYDTTLGDDDVASLDHDDDGIIDSKDDDDDGDGTPDAKDLDDDGDGISDIAEEDSDHDGTPDALDDDDDNDGIDDDADKDDDGDGTADDKEAKDNDGDGISDDKDADDDNDGTPDAKDTDDDGDGVDDAEDTDDDNDGVDDGVDADHDEDGDGTPDAADADDDGDGQPDATDTDEDNDGTPDATDTDDDNDGTPDAEDSDDDNDGVDDAEDPDHDNDGDGTPDAEDTDDDNDGTPDAADTDDDGDGESDTEEAAEEAEPEEEPAEEEPAEEEPEEEEPAEEEPAGEEPADDGEPVSIYNNDETRMTMAIATWTTSTSTTTVEFRSTTTMSADKTAARTTTTAYLKTTTPASPGGATRTRKIRMTRGTA